MSDAEKAAIVAELERIIEDWGKRCDDDRNSGKQAAQAFCSGICSGLAVAIQVVQAGGALPPERNEEGK
jgi:hypothetical protein